MRRPKKGNNLEIVRAALGAGYTFEVGVARMQISVFGCVSRGVPTDLGDGAVLGFVSGQFPRP